MTTPASDFEPKAPRTSAQGIEPAAEEPDLQAGRTAKLELVSQEFVPQGGPGPISRRWRCGSSPGRLSRRLRQSRLRSTRRLQSSPPRRGGKVCTMSRIHPRCVPDPRGLTHWFCSKKNMDQAAESGPANEELKPGRPCETRRFSVAFTEHGGTASLVVAITRKRPGQGIPAGPRLSPWRVKCL
jgi:hypothetical protein